MTTQRNYLRKCIISFFFWNKRIDPMLSQKKMFNHIMKIGRLQLLQYVVFIKQLQYLPHYKT